VEGAQRPTTHRRDRVAIRELRTNLRALILEDLERFPASAISDIHRRIGSEIPARILKRAIDLLVSERAIAATGVRRWTRQDLAMPIDQRGSEGR
jgi:hypothetical protein